MLLREIHVAPLLAVQHAYRSHGFLPEYLSGLGTTGEGEDPSSFGLLVHQADPGDSTDVPKTRLLEEPRLSFERSSL